MGSFVDDFWLFSPAAVAMATGSAPESLSQNTPLNLRLWHGPAACVWRARSHGPQRGNSRDLNPNLRPVVSISNLFIPLPPHETVNSVLLWGTKKKNVSVCKSPDSKS